MIFIDNKKYADKKYYQNKLEKIMIKLDIEKYNYRWTKTDAYIRFKYKNQWYQLNHNIEKANINRTSDNKLIYGSDVFAQLVLALEDLSRMSEYNIYDLSEWLSNMEVTYNNELPDCFKKIGFTGIVVPKQDVLEQKIKEYKKVLYPGNYFGDSEKYKELLEI